MKFLLSTVLSLSLLGAASTHAAAAYDPDLDYALALSLEEKPAARARTSTSWQCPNCTCINSTDHSQCTACDAPRPDYHAHDAARKAAEETATRAMRTKEAKAQEAADAAFARSLAGVGGGGGGGFYDLRAAQEAAGLAAARRLEAEETDRLAAQQLARAADRADEEAASQRYIAALRQAALDRDAALARQLEEDSLTADLLAAQAQNAHDAASTALARHLSAEEERPAHVIHDVRAQLRAFPAALPAPEAARALVGCHNPSGTCSMNAVLQILRHCPYMRSIITMTPESNLKPALLATLDHTAGPLDPVAYVSMNNSEATTFIEVIARIINADATLLPLITDIDLANSIEAVHDRRAPNAPAFVVLSTGRATAANLQETVTIGGVTYDLTGVVVHTGGHFFASVKQAGAWHGLDDLATGAIGDMAALRATIGAHTPCVLLYSKRS